MASVNQLLWDAVISHAANLRQYSEGVVHRMVAVLNRADALLFDELNRVLGKQEPSTFAMTRLESQLQSVAVLNAQAYSSLTTRMAGEMLDFARYEVGYQAQLFRHVLPINVPLAVVTGEQVYTAAMARPFQGSLLKGFLKDQELGRAKLIRRTVADGYVSGRTNQEIVRTLRGTRARGFEDGLMEVSRRDAATITRTAVQHLAGVTQDRFMASNADIAKAIIWSSTLDLRTSEMCRIRDHLKYTSDGEHTPIGHKVPWLQGPGRLHFNCRSSQVMVTKSLREMGINIDELFDNKGSRASMDGEVPKEKSYAEWIQEQSPARQDEVLGPNRGKLLRDGGLSLPDLYSARGEPLTLAQLREREAEAFKRAGL